MTKGSFSIRLVFVIRSDSTRSDTLGQIGIPGPAELVGEVEKPARGKHPPGHRVLGRRHAEEEAFQRCAEESAAAGEA